MKVSESDSIQAGCDLEKAVENLSLHDKAPNIDDDSKEINCISNEGCGEEETTLPNPVDRLPEASQDNNSQKYLCSQILEIDNEKPNISSIEKSLENLNLNEEAADENESDSESEIRKRGSEKGKKKGKKEREIIQEGPYSQRTNQIPTRPTHSTDRSNEEVKKIINYLQTAAETFEQQLLRAVTSVPQQQQLFGAETFEPQQQQLLRAETFVPQQQQLLRAEAIVQQQQQLLPDFNVLLCDYTVPSSVQSPEEFSPRDPIEICFIDSPPLSNISEFDDLDFNGTPTPTQEYLNPKYTLKNEMAYNEKTLPIPVPIDLNAIPDNQFSPQSTSSNDTGYMSDMSSSNSPMSSITTVYGNKRLTPILPNYVSNPEEGTRGIEVINRSENVVRKIRRNKYFRKFDVDDKVMDNKLRAVLKKGRDEDGLNQKDNENRTLLHIAINKKDQLFAITFINTVQKNFQNQNRKAEFRSFQSLPEFLNQQDNNGFTPLLAACANNLPIIVEYLLECGADAHLTETMHGDSPLHYVSKRGKRYTEVLEKLCEKVDANLLNRKMETPLHFAVAYHKNRHTDANINISEVVDNVPLIKVLLKSSARLSSQDEMGRTPLHYLILSNNLDLLDCLLSNASDWQIALNKTNNDGRTVMHEAVRIERDIEEQANLVRMLIARGASQIIPDNNGKLPRDLITNRTSVLLEDLNPDVIGYMGWINSCSRIIDRNPVRSNSSV